MFRSTSSRLTAQGSNFLRSLAAINANSGATATAATTTTTAAPLIINKATITTNRQQQKPAASAETSISESDKYLHYSNEEGYFKTSPFENAAPFNGPIHQFVWQDIKQWENKSAAVCIVSGREYTYAQLRDASAALAVRLQKNFKLKQGQILGLCLPNLPEYPIAALGALEAGLTVTTINPIYTAEEIARQLSFSNADFLIGTVAGYPVLKEACNLAKKNIPIACIRANLNDQLPANVIDFFELIKVDGVDYNDLVESDIKGNEMAFLPFSSGTTGLPKGVMLTHNNITVNCIQCTNPIPIDSLAYQDTIPGVLPFFHIYGLTVIMLSRLRQGCRIVTLPQFKPEDLIKSFTEYKASIMHLVPPIALFMIHHPKVTPETAPDLRMVMSGAAPIGASDVERFLKKFPKTQFLQGYGMTEASPVILVTPANNKRYASTGFLASNTEGKIISFDSSDLKGQGPNVTGELCVRGPQVMPGYLNDEKANKQTFYPGGWLRTGDVAYFDEDGYFYITDRMKELIKVKGFQVPPAELEAVLRDHPAIAEAAVFGIPHEINGEAPRALVVLKPGNEVTEEEIYNYVAERVAVYKKLDGGIIFTAEIPKNTTGKILRKELKEKFSS